MSQPLAETIFWIAAVACVVAEVAILRSMFVVRRANKSELVPTASRSGEVAWAVIPALVLSAALAATWQKIEARQTHSMMDHSDIPHSMPMPSVRSAAPRR